MTGGGVMNRRRFLEALAAVGVVVACGPTATPSPSPSSAGVSPAPKPVSIEWWRRNYAAGTQSAETITSDAAVKAYKDRAANVTIAIQGGPFGAETDQKFDIAILQQHAGPDVFHTTGGDVLKYAAAGQLSQPTLTDAERTDFNPSALKATTYKGTVVAYPLWIVPWFEYINLDLFKEAGVTPPANGNWTYDEFLAAAKKLTFKRADGKQIYGFAHANDEFAFMLIDGGRPYDSAIKTWTFNSADAVTGLEKWVALAQPGRKSAAGIYGDYNPAKAKVATMGAFTYVLPNVSTWSEIDQKYLRPARDAALEGKKTPKQALDEVATQAQKLLDEANK